MLKENMSDMKIELSSMVYEKFLEQTYGVEAEYCEEQIDTLLIKIFLNERT